MNIDLLEGARKDLARLRGLDPEAVATVLVVLEEADADPQLIDKLTTHGNVTFGDHRLNVKGWVTARRRSDNLLRFRVLDSPATTYRVVYGYDWRSRRIGVLAVVHKDEIDYGISSELAERILEDWRTATDGFDT